ncbi:tandem-95 repeat protein [Hymenobacter sediminis]|uniref:Ig-like domain-containing protein n=1 Tax=Hymenobacter sediminis TaxID=2218621 RepID=UPI000DA67FD5|nr:Ig-like domain-containing protein [Hymenobacter sediminis]RPD49370.1 tandem-95 repeat protein [Hymenobacter sediminis]
MKALLRALPPLVALFAAAPLSALGQTLGENSSASVPYNAVRANITLPAIAASGLKSADDYYITSYTPTTVGNLFVGTNQTPVGTVAATGATYTGSTVVPNAAPQLRFTPSGAGAIGSTVTFQFVGSDYGILSGRGYTPVAMFTISITNNAPTAATATGNMMRSTAGTATLAPTFSATDAESDLKYYTITGGLPTAAQGTLIKGSQPVVLGTATAQLTPAELSQLQFTPVAGFTGNIALTYTVTDGGNLTSAPATYTIRVGTPPSASNVRTAAMLSSDIVTNISALSAIAPAGSSVATYTLKSLPAGGTLYLNSTAVTALRSFTPAEAGQLRFDPAGNTSGDFTFTYTATNNTTATNNSGLESMVSTYTIPVANVPPVAVNDPLVVVARNQSATIDVVANDTDGDGAVAKNTVDLDPGLDGIQSTRTIANQGTFTVSAMGVVTFVPVNNYAGTTTITYTVRDNLGLTSNPASIQVSVSNVTTAYNDSNEVEKNTVARGNVILNDIDPNNTGFTVSVVSKTAHGELVLNSNGAYTYTPNQGYVGPDSFVYEACDKVTVPQCSRATVYLNVYDPAIYCIATTGPNLLVNSSFEQGNVGFNTNYVYKADEAGNAELRPETTYAIGPDAQSYHNNFFGYGRGGSADVANNFMMVNATSAIRTLYTQTFKVQPNRYYTFSAFFNNLLQEGTGGVDPEVGFVINGESTSATFLVPKSPDEWQQYSDVWYSGNNTTATFEIRNLTLAAGGNDIGIDDLYFGTCNAVPVANNTAASPIPSTAPATTIVAMDATDADGTIASFTLVSLPPTEAGILYVNGLPAQLGQVVLPADNQRLTFDPSGVRNGNITFTFSATDNTGSVSNTAIYTIPVGNTAPLAQNVTTTPISNTAAATAINPLVATDGDGTIVKYVITSLPNAQAGTLLMNGTALTALPREVLPTQLAQLSYDPSGMYAGNVVFNYYAVDNENNTSNTAIYTIPIGNQMPVSINKRAQAMRNTTGTTPLNSLESTDADGWIASYTIATLPTKGNLTLNGVLVSAGQSIRPEQAGELAYTPKTETGQFIFTYFATDNLGGNSNMASYVLPVSGPLPVTLVGFTAQATGAAVQLNWNTSVELNNDRFEVERSTNGQQFQRIGQVQGGGTTNTGATYAFTDKALPAHSGTVYYRLRQVDTNGQAEYSPVRTVALTGSIALAAQVTVVPNPFTSSATLDLSALPAGTYQVAVIDATGRVVFSSAVSGGQLRPLPTGTWPSGIYTLVVRGTNAHFTQRIVKQ